MAAKKTVPSSEVTATLKESLGLYTAEQVAEVLSVKPHTIKRFMSEGKLKYISLGGNTKDPRYRRISREGLDEYLAGLSAQPALDGGAPPAAGAGGAAGEDPEPRRWARHGGRRPRAWGSDGNVWGRVNRRANRVNRGLVTPVRHVTPSRRGSASTASLRRAVFPMGRLVPGRAWLWRTGSGRRPHGWSSTGCPPAPLQQHHPPAEG